MCKIGARCHPHTVEALASVNNRIADNLNKLAQCNYDIDAAVAKQDTRQFMSAKTRAVKVEAKVTELKVKRRHTRRDVYGTPTGLAQLEQRMLAANEPRALVVLAERRDAGILKREGRKHAAVHAQAGFANIAHGGVRPPIFLSRDEMATAA